MKKYSLLLIFVLIAIAIFLAEPALAISYQLKNPISGLTGSNPLTVAVAMVIGSVIKVFIGTAGAVALVLFVYGGATLISSTGNSDKITKGKKTLIWSTIGLVLVLFSYTIIDATILALTGDSAGGTNPPTTTTPTENCNTCTEALGQCAKCESYLSDTEDCTKANLEAYLSGYKCSEIDAYSDCQGGAACCSTNATFKPEPECETDDGSTTTATLWGPCTAGCQSDEKCSDTICVPADFTAEIGEKCNHSLNCKDAILTGPIPYTDKSYCKCDNMNTCYTAAGYSSPCDKKPCGTCQPKLKDGQNCEGYGLALYVGVAPPDVHIYDGIVCESNNCDDTTGKCEPPVPSSP